LLSSVYGLVARLSGNAFDSINEVINLLYAGPG